MLNIEYSFDHVGIAVKSIEEGAAFYKALGYEVKNIETMTSESVKVAMFELSNDSRIELLEGTSGESPISRFLNKKGPGIHHICLRVKDLRATLLKLKAQNIKLINDEPKKGAHGCEIAFVHPKSAGGVLIELSQKTGDKL